MRRMDSNCPAAQHQLEVKRLQLSAHTEQVEEKTTAFGGVTNCNSNDSRGQLGHSVGVGGPSGNETSVRHRRRMALAFHGTDRDEWLRVWDGGVPELHRACPGQSLHAPLPLAALVALIPPKRLPTSSAFGLRRAPVGEYLLSVIGQPPSVKRQPPSVGWSLPPTTPGRPEWERRTETSRFRKGTARGAKAERTVPNAGWRAVPIGCVASAQPNTATQPPQQRAPQKREGRALPWHPTPP
eukprot:CAMPEP_0174317774 /NCGR_PEP_ID=MMETSP0810-20121108/7782_1 /TAXON_ID=73025 ORGANISM="Eutreptiella gymnastica-like, Strain CCMP1594" /NCGR_SAMPLE_ID=MMETSP0810 /ASSEMBLY_ACC=CAM_ASM_000659 /LENGTH=239 /DNA_ID=CAMNT_0015427815 /DNA_START=1753 /DNA_END=2469 /DNA_ORIENTATION=+